MKVKVSQKLDNLLSLISQLKETSKDIGAIAIFIGTVRGTSGGEKVLRLEYDAHEVLAHKVLERTLKDVKKKYRIIDVIAEYRTGKVKVGEDVM